MGYTHYWRALRDVGIEEWLTITDDVRRIVEFAIINRRIALGDAYGAAGTAPEFHADFFALNGIGDLGHDTFSFEYPTRRGDRGFCKTASKPYDEVVTAVLCYVATATRHRDLHAERIAGSEAFEVTSDGRGADFELGLQLVRDALPERADDLDIPIGVMRDDRWLFPRIHLRCREYEIVFCVDGFGYVERQDGCTFRFDDHGALAQFLLDNEVFSFKEGRVDAPGYGYGRIEHDIWCPSGCMPESRQARLADAQRIVLDALFPPSESRPAPAFVRPENLSDEARRRKFKKLEDLANRTHERRTVPRYGTSPLD